ncbi:MAG TPA: SAM-dependent methyltransferase, partial [Candidatus Binatia bacterium]|nr:SAM-dependent methyltransferase [Candidatus Binatia bacterium]
MSVTSRGYNVLAKEYYETRKAGQRVENEYLEMPATLSLLGKVKGKKILDAGCGPGIYARILHNKGARVM